MGFLLTWRAGYCTMVYAWVENPPYTCHGPRVTGRGPRGICEIENRKGRAMGQAKRHTVGATHVSPVRGKHRPPKRAAGANHRSPARKPTGRRGAGARRTSPVRGEKKPPPSPAGTRRRKERALPPPESEVWPIWCRGELWDPVTAKYYIGRCQLCEHACRPSEMRRRLNDAAFVSTPLLCTEHPASPGKLREVMPTDRCRHFRQVLVQKPRVSKKENVDPRAVDWSAPEYKCYENSCRIKLSGDYFVIVDPEDYEELNRYKWCASNKRGMVYAMRRGKNGRTVYMHRLIMNAPKGSDVDHKNHRIWDNRRENLRVCTRRQNQMNKGYHGGSSGFVGVYPRGDHWEAGITSRGKHYYLGRFDDPVAAAKARDRKAWELHGEFAYLNFPEDYGQ